MSPERPRIFVSWPGYDPDDPETGARLVAAGYELALHPKTGGRSAQELSLLLGDAVGALVSTDPFERAVLEGAPQLRVIARVGVGFDSIDRAAADELGIAIATTPGQNHETVADHTLAMILALIRNVVSQDAATKAGGWGRIGAMTPSELAGRTVGLIGVGRIGRAVARRLRGFEVRIVAYDPAVSEHEGVVMLPSLEDVIREADILSLHAPLLPSTRGLLDAGRLALLRPGALVINTARGGMIDEAALFAALRAGRLGGAALDVFDEEPTDVSRFEGVPNLLVSPHIAGVSRESIRRMTTVATDNVLRVLAGEIPATIVNPEAVRARARA